MNDLCIAITIFAIVVAFYIYCCRDFANPQPVEPSAQSSAEPTGGESFYIQPDVVRGGYDSGPEVFELEGPGNAAWSGY